MSSGNDKRLWCAVILQAMEDAIANPGAHCRQHEIEQARNWFKRAGPDFRETCALAGYEPDEVQKKALAAIAANDNGVGLSPKVELASKPVRTIRTWLYQGQQLTARQLAEISGLSVDLIYRRLKAGWPIDLAVRAAKSRTRFVRSSKRKADNDNTSKPKLDRLSIRPRSNTRTFLYQGRKITPSEMASSTGLSLAGVNARLAKGWSVERIMSTPAIPRSERNKVYYESQRVLPAKHLF